MDLISTSSVLTLTSLLILVDIRLLEMFHRLFLDLFVEDVLEMRMTCNMCDELSTSCSFRGGVTRLRGFRTSTPDISTLFFYTFTLHILKKLLIPISPVFTVCGEDSSFAWWFGDDFR